MTRKILACTVCSAALSLAAQTSAMAQSVTLNGGGATLPQPTYQAEFDKYTNTNPSILFSYDGVGSGSGQAAFQNDDITKFNNPATQYGTQVGSTVHFGASDAFLFQSQVTTTGGYARSNTDGPLIQLPMIGVAVTIPFVNSGAAKKGLALTDDQLCGVFSGKITNWSQLSSKATAGQINVIYRSDGSGTSFLLTQHLNAVCTSSNSSFSTLPVPVTTSFASIFPMSMPPANFTGAAGSGGVATAMQASSNTFGYLSPDFTSIAPNSSNTTSLLVASLVNATDGTAYLPNTKNIEAGLNAAGPGSTGAQPPATKTAAQNPVNWVPEIPVTNKGYSIVGYTTWEVSTCYANATAAADIIDFLTQHYSNTAYSSLITKNGFVPLVNTKATAYVSAVTKTFLSNKNAYNLNIQNAKACAGLAGR